MVFKSNKDRIKEENKREKDQADKNRKSGEKLAISMSNAAGKARFLNDPALTSIHQRMLNEYTQMLKASSTITGYDTAVVDEQLERIIACYGEALEYRDLDTLERAQNAIKAGIELRKELSDTEERDAENAVGKKENQMKDWASYVETSRAYFKNTKNEERLNEKAKAYKEEYMKGREKYYAKATKSVEEELDSFRPGIDQLSSDAGEAFVEKQRLVKLAKLAERIIKEKTMCSTQAQSMETMLKTMAVQISNQVFTMTEEARETIVRMQDQIRETQQKIEDDIVFSDKIFDKMNDIVDTFYNSKERGDRIVRANADFQKLEEELSRKMNDTPVRPIIHEEENRQTITN